MKGMPVHIARDSRGKFIVLVPGQLPQLYGTDGRFLQEIGRAGEGPGEFVAAAHVTTLPGDSLLVLDAQLRRASVLRPDLSFARAVSIPLRAGSLAVLRWPQLVMANGISFTPEHAGWPLHLLDLSGPTAQHKGSFGDNRGELRAGQPGLLTRRFMHASREGFWAAHALRYQAARYSLSGKTVDVLLRRPSWFSKESAWTIGSPRIPPPPIVDAVMIRGDTLWVAIRTARPDWSRAWEGVTIPPSGELTSAQVPDRTRLYRSRLEVIDLKHARLLTQKAVDGIVVYLGKDLTAIVYDLVDDLLPRLRVFDLRLRKETR